MICFVDLYEDGESLGIDFIEIGDMRELPAECVRSIEMRLQKAGGRKPRNPSYHLHSVF